MKPKDLIIYTTKSLSRYEESLPEVMSLISNGGLPECKIVISELKKIIKDKNNEPPQKLFALEVFQACMLLNKSEFISFAQSKILKRFGELAKKSSSKIFKDSESTFENKRASEKFRNNLLDYIYIWANEFGSTPNKKPSEYAKIFYKLRETITFPPAKPRESLRKSLSVKKKPRAKKFNLEYFENMLDLLEQMPNFEVDEAGKEMISVLKKVHAEFEKALGVSISSKNTEETEKMLKINDRMQKFLMPNAKNRHSLPVNFKKSEIFDDILGIEEISANASPEKQFYTEVFNSNGSSFMEKFLLENSSSSDLRVPGSVSEIEEIYESQVRHLQKIITEKEEKNKELTQNCQLFQEKIHNLESMVQRIKEMLYSKERECEEYHCLKPNFAKAPEFTENIFVPPPALSLKTFFSSPIEQSFQNDDKTYIYACCDMSSSLLSTEECELSFQGGLDGLFYKISLILLNKSASLISEIDFEIESAFGFNIELSKAEQNYIGPGTHFLQELAAELLCPTHIPPLAVLKFLCGPQRFNYIIKLPLSVCKFSKITGKTHSELWTNWEFLAFDNEIASCRLELSLHHYKKLLKLSQNCVIFTTAQLAPLQENQCLGIFELSKTVYILLTLKPNEHIVEIEVRCDLVSLRKSMLLLVLKQISHN